MFFILSGLTMVIVGRSLRRFDQNHSIACYLSAKAVGYSVECGSDRAVRAQGWSHRKPDRNNSISCYLSAKASVIWSDAARRAARAAASAQRRPAYRRAIRRLCPADYKSQIAFHKLQPASCVPHLPTSLRPSLSCVPLSVKVFH